VGAHAVEACAVCAGSGDPGTGRRGAGLFPVARSDPSTYHLPGAWAIGARAPRSLLLDGHLAAGA